MRIDRRFHEYAIGIGCGEKKKEVRKKVSVPETDTTGDGKINDRVYYENGKPVKAEKDTNKDGNPDTYITYWWIRKKSNLPCIWWFFIYKRFFSILLINFIDTESHFLYIKTRILGEICLLKRINNIHP